MENTSRFEFTPCEGYGGPRYRPPGGMGQPHSGPEPLTTRGRKALPPRPKMPEPPKGLRLVQLLVPLLVIIASGSMRTDARWAATEHRE